MTYSILVVEDNDDVFSLYQRAIEDNDANDILSLVREKNKFDAETRINSEDFDAVIMDLKIPLDCSDKDSSPSVGESLLKETLSKIICPVIVVSATPGVLDDGAAELPAKLRIIAKKTGYNEEAVQHLLSLDGLLKVLPDLKEARANFNTDFIETFWDLYSHWDQFKEKFKDEQRVPQVMKRHISNYLVEKWTADANYGHLHYSEFYFHPPVRSRLYTGDIVEYEGGTWIIATPPCDMERTYPTNLIMLKCVFVEHSDQSLSRIRKFKNNGENEEHRLDVQNKVSELFTKQKDHEHILPPFHSSESSLMKVNFKELMTIPSAHVDQLERKTTLNSYFLPSLLQRYGAYISRLGQPEICAKDFLHYLVSKVPDGVNDI
jgi:CheY-like chemotaxis protein